MDCSPPGSSVHGISQARILEWVAIPFSRGSFHPRGQIWVFCIAGRFFTFWAPREVLIGNPGKYTHIFVMAYSVQFSSVAQPCLPLCQLMDCSMPGFPVHHQLPGLNQTRICHIGDAIQPSHPLLSPSPPTLNLSQHQGLFKWVSSSHQVAKVLEFQIQYQSFQGIFRTDLF